MVRNKKATKKKRVNKNKKKTISNKTLHKFMKMYASIPSKIKRKFTVSKSKGKKRKKMHGGTSRAVPSA